MFQTPDLFKNSQIYERYKGWHGVQAHIPVMVAETLELLAPAPGKKILDCTVGAGGHAAEILKRIQPGGLLIGLDRDPRMLEQARAFLKEEGFPDNSLRLFPFSYERFDEAFAQETGTEPKLFDGILFDLGVASPHLDQAERGFSWNKEGPLDFRFDAAQKLTAFDVVNKWRESELRRVFKEYSDERFSGAMARRICKEREVRIIKTTTQLADILRKSIPSRLRSPHRDHVQTAFQAIRIAVNDELGIFEKTLPKALSFLAENGVCAVLAYHSKEDRVSKIVFAEAAGKKGTGMFEILTKKPLMATNEEIRRNARARSARLRAIRRKPADSQSSNKEVK
ncbi:MAG: Ribosomal RNA small subunit methyltransferase H [candidate division BRC1 bacterium ADurb.Bin183]|nr:MAG: Ribosomal RNA small subunit methyltransferase H [candidate division BRC1 bacterium ADurb.Bin183]